MKVLLVSALIATSLFAYPQTQDSPNGNIKGTVSDDTGTPVFDATVYAVPQDLTLEGIAPRSVRTDRSGTFDFTGGLPWGNYKVYTEKDKDGYPNPLDSFYRDLETKPVEVQLSEGSSSAEVSLQMGERAGIITGRVLDADTGAPLKVRLGVLYRDDKGGGDHGVNSRAKDGEYRVLVPPGKDIIVMVHIEPGDRSLVPTPALRLESGQEVVMDIPVSRK